MKYNDEMLYQKTTIELKQLEEKMNVRQFRKWSIFRFKSLIHQATFYVKDWNEPNIKFLREYRIKSMSFYQKKGK
jgi:hypothetical protein